MSSRSLLALLLLPAMFSCKDKDSETETEADTDTDSDSDADTDSDTDSDTDTDVLEEDCATPGDEDGNGDADCDDAACANDPACASTCADAVAGAPPATVTGTTVGATDDWTSSCVTSGADYAVEFTAPTAGDYVVDLMGSDYDTVLSVFDGCNGAEIACNDDALPGLISAVPLSLAANQTVIIAISGFQANQGNFQLNIVGATPEVCDNGVDDDLDGLPDCIDDDCDNDAFCIGNCPDIPGANTVPTTITGTTIGQSANDTTDCGGDFAPDTTVEFIAPTTGRFIFSLDSAGTNFDSILEVRTSCSRADAVDCQDAFDFLNPNGGETVFLDMTAGDTAIVSIDGFAQESGDFELLIDEVATNETDCTDGVDEDYDGLLDCLDDDCSADASCIQVCPAIAGGTTVPTTVTGSLVGLADVVDASCGPLDPSSSTTFDFTAPNDGVFIFKTDPANTAVDINLSMFNACGGTEVACEDEFFIFGEEIRTAMTAGQTVILGVQATIPGDAGDFAIDVAEVLPNEIDCADGNDEDFDGAVDCLDDDCDQDASCIQACPALTATAVPSSVTGSIENLSDEVDSTCGPPVASPSTTVGFTAPADGVYAFGLDPNTTNFPAVVSIFGSCGGAEIDCSSGFPFGASVVTANMTAGQTILVGVETIGPPGDFELDIVEVAATETVCDDGYDEDGDGLWDCADDDCAGNQLCVEACDDLLDNDVDGLVDCADDDCAADPSCVPTCPDQTLTDPLPISVTGSTLGLPNGTALASCGGNLASDTTFQWTAPADGTYTIDTVGSTYDTLLSVYDGCGGLELGCNDDTPPGLTSSVTVTLTAGDTIVIAVDGFGTQSGDFVLNIQ